MRTRKQQDIEQVACIITENGLTFDEAREVNETTGWTFEVRYDEQDYVDERNFTLVEDRRLNPIDLRTAFEEAR